MLSWELKEMSWKKNHTEKVLNKRDWSTRCHVDPSTWQGCVCLILQLCPTLCDPVDCSPPASSVHGILQTRNRSKLPCPPPRDLPKPGIEPRSPILQAESLQSEAPEKPFYPTNLFIAEATVETLVPQDSPNCATLSDLLICHLHL